MNRTGIEWADFTWNPVSGCRRQCAYCYAFNQSRRFCGDVRMNMADDRCKRWPGGDNLFVLDRPFVERNDRAISYPFGFEPTLHKYRLAEPQKLKKGYNIFVCSMADLFGPWVPDAWIDMVMEACDQAPQHNYMFLTKSPERLYSRVYSENMWVGRSVTTIDQAKQLPRRDPEQDDGFKANTFLSIEPLLEPVAAQLQDVIPYEGWVIIGPETGRHGGKVVPQREWVEEIVGLCVKHKVPVFMKDALALVWEDDLLRQYPELLCHHNPPASENKLYARCSFCKALHPRTDLTTLLARFRRGESALSVGQACTPCYKLFQEYIASDIPMEGFDYEGDSEGI